MARAPSQEEERALRKLLEESIVKTSQTLPWVWLEHNPCLDIPVDHEKETAALKAKYGQNFEPDFSDNDVIGTWKQPKTTEYRKRWNGTKYVYDEIK